MNASVLHTATNLEILIIATFALMMIYPMHLMTLDSTGETVCFQMRQNISVHSIHLASVDQILKILLNIDILRYGNEHTV